jgi:CheY-like chemotaxis protein
MAAASQTTATAMATAMRALTVVEPLSTWNFPPTQLSVPRYRQLRRPAAIRHEGQLLDKNKKTILVIEDDLDILATVADVLEFEGYEVEKATNGAEGLAALERAKPALVLLDMRMPVLDGWEFARILKERGVKVPVLVMTAAQDAKRWAQEINADGYVAKPFHLIDLIAAVERFLDSGKDN